MLMKGGLYKMSSNIKNFKTKKDISSLTGLPSHFAVHSKLEKTIIAVSVLNDFRDKKNKILNNVSSDNKDLSILKKVNKLISKMNFNENVPLYVTTVEGNLAYVNDGYKKLAMDYNLEAREVGEGLNIKRTLPDSLISILNEVQLTNNILNFEEEIKLNSSIKCYQSRHFPICDNSGEVIAVGGTYVEKIENKNYHENISEARFRDFARSTSDWYWEVNKNFKITYADERLAAIFGEPSFTLKGKSLEDLGSLKTSVDGIKIKIIDIMDGITPFRDQLFVLKNLEGEDVFIHLSGVPLFDPQTGKFFGYRGAGMDVTVKYKAEREKNRIQKSLENTLDELTNKNIQLDIASAEAEDALNAKSEFLAAMSHELRTPLNAIIGFAEVMRLELFGDLNSKYVSYSSDIMNAGQHLLALINDVLDVAVLENGTLNLNIEETGLNEHIKTALNLVILRANDKNIDTSRVEVATDYLVYVDQRRVTQILVNLLSNAVKFTPEGGSIGIDIAPSKINQSLLEITVWDTGIGIPEDQLDLIFEKFQQAKGSIYSREQEGTGLGLHISRHLAMQMNGDIIVKSIVGKGTEFSLLIPIASSD